MSPPWRSFSARRSPRRRTSRRIASRALFFPIEQPVRIIANYHTTRRRSTLALVRRACAAPDPERAMKLKLRDRLKFAAVACLVLVLPAGEAAAQQSPAPAQAQFVGTWSLVSIRYVEKDGRKVEPFGPSARGMLVFDAGGRFATQVMAANRPPFASNNRMTGTPEENRAVSQGVVAYFGTYTVDEPNQVVTLHIEQSSFPNWNG